MKLRSVPNTTQLHCVTCERMIDSSKLICFFQMQPNIHYEYSWYFQAISMDHFPINISQSLLGLLYILSCLHQFYFSVYCKRCQSEFQKHFFLLIFLWFSKTKIRKLVFRARGQCLGPYGRVIHLYCITNLFDMFGRPSKKTDIPSLSHIGSFVERHSSCCPSGRLYSPARMKNSR